MLGFMKLILIQRSGLSGSPSPLSSPSSLLLLANLETLLQDADISPWEINEDVDFFLKHCFIVMGLLKGVSWVDFGDKLSVMPWWRCEGKDSSSGKSECRVMEAGEEMMACGRVSSDLSLPSSCFSAVDDLLVLSCTVQSSSLLLPWYVPLLFLISRS